MTRNEAHEVLEKANLKISLVNFRTRSDPRDQTATRRHDSHSLWSDSGNLVITIESHDEQCEVGAALAAAIETLGQD